MFEIVSYAFTFHPNSFVGHEHKFKFETFIGVKGFNKSFLDPKGTILTQYVKSKATNGTGGDTYFDTTDQFRDDKYCITDFSDIGQPEPDVTLLSTNDNPGFENTLVMNSTFISYEFEFYQTLGKLSTPRFKVTIRGRGANATMTVGYNGETFAVGPQPMRVSLF